MRYAKTKGTIRLFLNIDDLMLLNNCTYGSLDDAIRKFEFVVGNNGTIRVSREPSNGEYPDGAKYRTPSPYKKGSSGRPISWIVKFPEPNGAEALPDTGPVRIDSSACNAGAVVYSLPKDLRAPIYRERRRKAPTAQPQPQPQPRVTNIDEQISAALRALNGAMACCPDREFSAEMVGSNTLKLSSAPKPDTNKFY